MSKSCSGGCGCGAIRYESTAEPVLMLHCHCRDCQRSSGGPFSSFVILPTEALKLLQGALRGNETVLPASVLLNWTAALRN